MEVSKEKFPLLPNQSVCCGPHTVCAFLPLLLVTCSHAPLLLPHSVRVISGCFQNFEFLGQEKGAGFGAGGRERLTRGLGALSFYLLYFHWLAVIMDPLGVEIEKWMASKQTQIYTVFICLVNTS